jgi:hypothetical protein
MKALRSMITPPSARPIERYVVMPPALHSKETLMFGEALNAKLIWLMLNRLMLIPEQGRILFTPPLSNQNRLWREFANYVRQGNAYWSGAEHTPGSSAALLYYYAFLNLAKAELLMTRPADIEGQSIHHGLSFSPTRAHSVAGDVVKVVNGVFPMLYEKRTGLSISPGTLLSIPRMLSALPEIGLELEASGIAKSRIEIGYHTIAVDSFASWVLLATTCTGFLAEPQHATTKLLDRYFDTFRSGADAFPDWRKLFGLSVRGVSAGLMVLQSKATFSATAPDGSIIPDQAAAFTYLHEVASPYVNDPIGMPVDVVLTPSLLKSRELPMPASLARYALMFYVSSLVRYKPSALDPIRQAQAAWLFDSFAEESPLRLLANSLSGIIDRPLAFEASGFRT